MDADSHGSKVVTDGCGLTARVDWDQSRGPDGLRHVDGSVHAPVRLVGVLAFAWRVDRRQCVRDDRFLEPPDRSYAARAQVAQEFGVWLRDDQIDWSPGCGSQLFRATSVGRSQTGPNRTDRAKRGNKRHVNLRVCEHAAFSR